jgi:hypothetical protein
MTVTGQLDIFGALEEIRLDQVPLCLYASPARGLTARAAEFEEWRAQHGSFGSYPRSHAWHPYGWGAQTTPADRCQAAILTADLRGSDGIEASCDCTKAESLLYRGACCCCNWEGPERCRENPAAEDGLDHAWPGWRDLPVVPRMPDSNGPRDKYARDQWTASVISLYPDGWLEAGAPIRTLRKGPYGLRHIPGVTPFGGHDVGVPEVGAAA